MNAMDKQGLTPLMWAAAHRQVNLLDSGIDFCDVEKISISKKVPVVSIFSCSKCFRAKLEKR